MRQGPLHTREISDPDVRMLAAISGTLEGDYPSEGQEGAWAGTPFNWIRQRPSSARGKIREQLVAGWCAAKGLDVTASGDSEADRVIAGHRVEIKSSTLWRSAILKFQQIRDQNYELAICLGICPFDAYCWVIPKNLLYEHVIGHTPQHGGRTGTDTFWLSFAPTNPPQWLEPCGGTLAKANAVLQRVARGHENPS